MQRVEDFILRHAEQRTDYRHPHDMPRRIKVGGQYRILDADEAVWIACKQGESTGRAA
jgi:hypothetical protein